MIFKPAQLGMAKLDPQELEADKKACRKIGPCGVGKKALYLNSFYIDRRYYLPYGSITRVFKRVAMSSGGFSGKGVFASMAYLVVEYDGGKQKQCNFKDERDVDALLEVLAKEQPQLHLLSAAGEQALEKKAAEKAEKAGKYVWEHRRGFAIAAAILLMLAFLLNGLSSCSVMMDGIGSGIAASTYPSQDADMLGAEAQYCAMEAELQRYLDTYESTHDYDEYHFDLDTIEHDPYVLISMITALHQGEWTLDEVQGTLQMLFDRQYILTEDVVVETRYRTETDTWTDADGNTHTDTYQVPYDYYICTVTLENFNLSHVPVYIMSEEQLGMYATYMATLGNRPDLFPGSGYIGKYVEGSYTDYDIPPEALDDEVFAAIIKEAEKYLGYPYVWGGSSPSTSFDCSGFVSWVINHSGWDVGRLGAQGLCNICTPVSSANVKPGDLVFFTGTYDTPGVSHVGIYVGNNMMIHCGDPISYANLNSSYWQSHFYRYGRLP